MGLGFALELLNAEFDIALALNAAAYLGCALYGLPKLYRLIFKENA